MVESVKSLYRFHRVNHAHVNTFSEKMFHCRTFPETPASREPCSHRCMVDSVKIPFQLSPCADGNDVARPSESRYGEPLGYVTYDALSKLRASPYRYLCSLCRAGTTGTVLGTLISATMGRKCFVPNCKTGYQACKKKLCLFSAPKDEERLKLSRNKHGSKERRRATDMGLFMLETLSVICYRRRRKPSTRAM